MHPRGITKTHCKFPETFLHLKLKSKTVSFHQCLVFLMKDGQAYPPAPAPMFLHLFIQHPDRALVASGNTRAEGKEKGSAAEFRCRWVSQDAAI